MIVVRRAATVPLIIVLTVVLALTLVAHRVNSTLLSPQFHQEQLTAIGAFDAVHDEVLPRALDDFLVAQDEKIPDNLEGITLPTEASAQATILEFGQTALPPAYLESQANAAIEAVVGYLRGERTDLDLTISLNEPLRSALLADSGGRTEFEQAWDGLDLSETAIAGLARSVEIPQLDGLRNPLSLLVLARLRAEGMPLDEASTLVATIYEVAPDAEVERITKTALAGDATFEELEDLKTLLVVTRLVPAEPARALVDAVAVGTSPSDDLLTVLLGDERDEAVHWFEGELFAAIGELASYLAGDSDNFAIRIEFDRYPELAPVIAGALNSDPATLLRDGFRLNGVDIQRELDASDDPPVASLDEARTIFTVNGRTFGLDDFERDDDAGSTQGAIGASAASEEENAGLDLASVRAVVAPASRWAVPAGVTATLWLAIASGFLGGRAWWSRAVWAAAATAGSSAVIAIVTGPVFSVIAAPRLTSALSDNRADLAADDASWTPLALRALDQIEVVANQQASALATNALLIAVGATVVGAGAVAWHVYATRRPVADPSLAIEVAEESPIIEESEQPARAA